MLLSSLVSWPEFVGGWLTFGLANDANAINQSCDLGHTLNRAHTIVYVCVCAVYLTQSKEKTTFNATTKDDNKIKTHSEFFAVAANTK